MAKEEKKAEAQGAEVPKSAPRRTAATVLLLNTVVVAGTLGFLAYSKLFYKRKPITEKSERERLEVLEGPKTAPSPGFLVIPTTTLNIAPNPENPRPLPGTTQQIAGKLHYLTIGLSLQTRDQDGVALLEKARPFILDKLIQHIGKKQFHELTHVQGRYLLRSEIVELANQAVEEATGTPSASDDEQNPEKVVTDVYFNEFLVQ